jgi:hypothetical protein
MQQDNGLALACFDIMPNALGGSLHEVVRHFYIIKHLDRSVLSAARGLTCRKRATSSSISCGKRSESLGAGVLPARKPGGTQVAFQPLLFIGNSQHAAVASNQGEPSISLPIQLELVRSHASWSRQH